MKKIKDPIYGYISVDINYMKNIIDTPVFQRLRRVMQTSYSPLYSSALHNRFVHSLGVYHLGTIVSESLRESLEEMSIESSQIDKLIHVYLLACLLHDVGHGLDLLSCFLELQLCRCFTCCYLKKGRKREKSHIIFFWV